VSYDGGGAGASTDGPDGIGGSGGGGDAFEDGIPNLAGGGVNDLLAGPEL